MSTGGRVFPSVTGGGLTRAAQAIVEGRAAAQARELQERQVSIQEQSLALNQWRLLSDLTDPDTRLGDLQPSQIALFERAFNTAAEGPILDLNVNRETTDEFLDRMTTELIVGDGGETDIMLQMIRSRRGLTPDPRIAARDREMAELERSAIATVTSQEDIAEMGRRIIGENPITIRFPGVEGEFTFDSPTAASIYAAEFARRSSLVAESELTLVQSVIDAAGERGFVIGPPAAETVIGIYDRMRETGDPTEFNEFLNNVNNPTGMRLGLASLVTGIAVGEQVIRQHLPAGFNLSTDIGDSLAEHLPKETVDEIMPGIINQLGIPGIQFTPRIFGIVGRPEMIIGGQALDPLSGELQPIGGPTSTAVEAGADRQTMVTAAFNILGSGQFTPEQVVEMVGDPEVVAEAQQIREAAGAPLPELTAEERAAAERLGLPAAVAQEPGRAFGLAGIPENQAMLIEQKQRQLAGLQSEPVRGGAAQRRLREESIARLEQELLIDMTELPFLPEARDGLPAGGLDPAMLPGSVRETVSRFNALIRRLERTGSVRAQTNLSEEIRRVARLIRVAVAGA